MLRTLTSPDIFFSVDLIRSLRVEFSGTLKVCSKGGVGLEILTIEGLESSVVGARSSPRRFAYSFSPCKYLLATSVLTALAKWKDTVTSLKYIPRLHSKYLEKFIAYPGMSTSLKSILQTEYHYIPCLQIEWHFIIF